MANTPDIDYLYASARVRALESNLLNQDRLRRMAEAGSDADALKVLTECGYGEELSVENLSVALRSKRETAFSEAEKMLPEPRLLDIFRLKYDYHNLKCLLKGQAGGQSYEQLLLNCGTVSASRLLQTAEDNNYADLPPIMREAARGAEEILNRTHDPRLADTALDRAMFMEMLTIAKESGVKFLIDYVTLAIDSANLRAAVRLKKMGQDYNRLTDFYCEGGTIALARLRIDLTPEALESIYANTPLSEAALAGAQALRGASGLAAMDLSADNALMAQLKMAKYIGFGVEPVLAFYAAADSESAAINTVIAGRRSGDAPDTIMERLRNTYV